MLKSSILVGLSLMPFYLAQGALVINGDMSSVTYATGGNHAAFQDVDQGWAVKSQAAIDLTTNPGQITWDGPTVTLLEDGLAQINSITTETGSVLNLSFDWTAASGATVTNTDLEYQVVAWTTNSTPAASAVMFNNINGSTKKVTAVGGGQVYDLLNNGATGTGNAQFGTVAGTAGSTVSAMVTVDLSNDTGGITDISGYDFIGIRFHIAGDNSDLTAIGSMLDNVSLSIPGAPLPEPPQPLATYDTGYTIQKVRTAVDGTNSLIIASSYEGSVLGIQYDGTVLWTNALSGYMNHDLWCADITGDGTDEILIANADGTLYCLNAAGVQQWQFIPNAGGHLPPMYAVCVVHSGGTPYVVCGPYDMNIYYLNASGTLVKTVDSATYSKEKPWGSSAPPLYIHNANFLRPIPQPDGSEKLAVLGTMNHMQSKGSIYLFDAFADLPYSTNTVQATDDIGEFHVVDPDGDGTNEVLLGSSALNSQGMTRFDPVNGAMDVYPLTNLGYNGYRVTQAETIKVGNSFQYFMLCGGVLTLGNPSFDTNVVSSVEQISCSYAFNDMWKDSTSGKIILASAQSGGSCIHIIDPRHSTWKTDYANINPPGKIAAILSNTAAVRSNLASFSKPAWERNPEEVVLTSADPTHPVAQSIMAGYSSPVFLNYSWSGHAQDPLDWNRDTVLASNPVYRDKRDKRRTYDWTQQQVLNDIIPDLSKGGTGLAMWGGHGNDPYYYSMDTLKAIIGLTGTNKTVLIWPEMNGSSTEFEMVMNDRFYPLADFARTNNANIYVRNKNIFWQGAVYLPAWARMRDGDYADVFVSGLEETSDKTQELSVSGRMGLWASGAMNHWGMRCSRDNPSFDRQRQHSYQKLPNHFLRNMVYNLAYGASVLNVTYVDADYQSLAWELVAKGALFVPKREEIVSFSPVHLSMTNPDPHYLEDGENNKWTTFYDQAFEQNNPFVFSHMNGSWPAAPNTQWDFSRYAAGVKDRRQNFLPPYKNGMVLITPPQQGVYANTNAARGLMTTHLHPLYKNIMQEYITDGRNYLSEDGSATNAADTYYTTVSNAISQSSAQLPLTVSGEVAWVCAQTATNHLRLTLVDSGYLNPKARTATVTFHTVTPVTITDVLDGSTYSVSNSATSIDVPLGLFRFIDIELASPFFPSNKWGSYASDYGLSGNPLADWDNDGESDMHEYALGGNPTNPAIKSIPPALSFGTNNLVTFLNLQVAATNPGISYMAEWTDNLVTGSWNSTWDSVNTSGSGTPAGYNQLERNIDGSTNPQLYFRLKVSQ